MTRNLLLFALLCVVWGLTWGAVKIGLEVLPPVMLAAMRYLSTAALLLLAARGSSEAFADGRAGRTVLSSLLVNTGTYGFLFWGMQTVPSGVAGLVNLALIPILLGGLAAATGEERPTPQHLVALVVGSVGLIGLFWARLGDGGTWLGLAAIVAGTASYCIGSVVARPLVGPVPPLALTAVQALIGGVPLLFLSLITEPVSAATLGALTAPKAIGSLTFLVLFGTIVGYTIYLGLLRDWGTVRAGLYAFVSPIVALAVGALAFGERIGPVEIGGAGLMLLAAAIALNRPKVEHAT